MTSECSLTFSFTQYQNLQADIRLRSLNDQGRRNDFKSVWAKPEKADEGGGGGGGGDSDTFFFFRSSYFFDIYI